MVESMHVSLMLASLNQLILYLHHANLASIVFYFILFFLPRRKQFSQPKPFKSHLRAADKKSKNIFLPFSKCFHSMVIVEDSVKCLAAKHNTIVSLLNCVDAITFDI